MKIYLYNTLKEKKYKSSFWKQDCGHYNVVFPQTFSHTVMYGIRCGRVCTAKSSNSTQYLASEVFGFPASLNSLNIFRITRRSLTSRFFGKVSNKELSSLYKDTRKHYVIFHLKFCCYCAIISGIKFKTFMSWIEAVTVRQTSVKTSVNK